MKTNYLTIAFALATASITPVHATQILFTTASSSYTVTSNGATGTIKASGYDGLTGGNGNPNADTLSTANIKSATLDIVTNADSTKGLGLYNTYTVGGVLKATTDIEPNDFIVLDFSGAQNIGSGATAQTLNSVSFNLYVDQISSTYHYAVYGFNSGSTVPGSLTPAMLLTSGGIGTLGQIPTSAFSGYTSFIIAVDCPVVNIAGIDIQSATLNYTTSKVPEPATYMTAGMALVGLGLMLKKRAKQA